MTLFIVAVLATLLFLGARSLWRAFRRHSGAQATHAIWWGMGTGLAAVLLSVPPLVMAFAQVAHAEVAQKSAMLAVGITEAFAFTGPALLAGLALAFSGGVARGFYGPARKPPSQAEPAS
jgi:hypothetical protein